MGPPRILGALQRVPKRLVLAFTASVLVVVAAALVADLWWRRERTLKTAESRADNLAYVLSEYVRESFEVADTSLRQLAIHGRRIGGAAAPASDWEGIIAAAHAAVPGSGSISVTDADGIIRYSTQKPIIGQSRSDNYIFKQLAKIDRDELIVDRPYLTPIEPGRFVIPIGRRLLTPEGRFGGTVVAVVMPEAFREFFRTVDVGGDGILWVFHPEGVLLFREPSTTNPIGQTAAGNPVLRAALRATAPGVVEGPLEQGGPAYLSAYRPIGTPPLVLAVSLNRSEMLADWRAQRRTSSIAFGVLTMTLAVIVLVLFRQIDARTKAERELSEAHRLESIRLREANEQLEAALEREQRARQEAEAASYLKDEFLMTVSHELRTPLTAIYGWVRMLSSDTMPPEQRARALAALDRNARAQTRLIDDLLDVSRAVSGRLRLDARRVNVGDVVLLAAETLGPALEAKALTFDADIDADLEPVLLDPDRVQQIVWNLLSNAMKFTPEGGRVHLHVGRVPAGIEIAISDTGVGISPDFMPYVFDRFRQGDAGSRRRFGGLGLGLAIVRHLAELHGGTVSAESAGEDQGATFRVVLPARAPRAAQASPTTAPLGDVRVLEVEVDDEVDARST